MSKDLPEPPINPPFNLDKPFVLPKGEVLPPHLFTALTPAEMEALNPPQPQRPSIQPSESNPVTLEEIKEIFGGYLKTAYKDSWSGTPEQIAKAGEQPEMRKPQDIVWSNAVNKEPAKFGEFTMNPDTISVDWEQIPKEKIKVVNPLEINPALTGKKRWEVAKYLTTEWPNRDRYLFPGIEYWKYIFEHPDQAPAEMRSTATWNYFIGSMLRDTDGDWGVPHARWNGASFGRDGDWLSFGWVTGDRVVLLEK